MRLLSGKVFYRLVGCAMVSFVSVRAFDFLMVSFVYMLAWGLVTVFVGSACV